MRRKRLLFALALLSVACSPQSNNETLQIPSAESVYFPLIPYTNNPKPDDPWYTKFSDPYLSEFEISWYTKHVRALEQPSLYEASQNKQRHTYRFLWLRSFDAPIALRLEVQTDGGGLLIVKEASGKGGSDPGTLSKNQVKRLRRVAVSRFLSMLDAIKYWEMPSEEGPVVNPDGSVVITADGAQWILEGVKEGRYHVVDRTSPKTGTYRDTALWLLSKSGLRIWLEDIY